VLTPTALFQLAIRVVGLVFLYHGLANLPGSVLGVFFALKAKSLAGFLGAGFTAFWPLFLAWWLIRGAPWLMRLSRLPTDGGSTSDPRVPPPLG
jgi:hypothetical protein